MQRYPEFVQNEIENWIVYCWCGTDPTPQWQTRCGSAEGRYRAPYWDAEDLPKSRIYFRENAERVQRLYEVMPPITRRILRYEYTCRSHYDQWTRGEEVKDGQLVPTWVRTGNNKRETACRELGISKSAYKRHVQSFKQAVYKEFM